MSGVTRLGRVPTHTETKQLGINGVGPTAIRILREALAENGLTFRSS